MSLFRVVSNFFLALILCFTATVDAKSNDPIMCPKLDKIHQAAALINYAGFEPKYPKGNSDYYYAGTEQTSFEDSNLYWDVAVLAIVATSTEEAIEKAKYLVANVSVMESEVALANEFIIDSASCLYYVTPYVSNVMIMAIGTTKPHSLEANFFLKNKI